VLARHEGLPMRRGLVITLAADAGAVVLLTTLAAIALATRDPSAVFFAGLAAAAGLGFLLALMTIPPALRAPTPARAGTAVVAVIAGGLVTCLSSLGLLTVADAVDERMASLALFVLGAAATLAYLAFLGAFTRKPR